MSTEKNRIEANRWLHTADDDLDSAIILKENSKFAHSCFHAQQAAEKALKAVWYHSDADPWGHSIKRLIDDLRKFRGQVLFFALLSLGNVLDIPLQNPGQMIYRRWMLFLIAWRSSSRFCVNALRNAWIFVKYTPRSCFTFLPASMAMQNIREAIELYLESVEDDQTYAPNAELMELAL